jgi:hypothetical protein
VVSKRSRPALVVCRTIKDIVEKKEGESRDQMDMGVSLSARACTPPSSL